MANRSGKNDTPHHPVSLVGAGPGDPALLTVRAYEVLQLAEVVLTDALLTEGIRELVPKTAQVIYVGKRANAHTLGQSEINLLLFEKAREGKRVVRLKGGDPFIYGRGAEEAQFLQAKGMNVEVIPGLSSALTVPAMAGIPVLHREKAGSVLILHGQVAPPRLEDFETTIEGDEDIQPPSALTSEKGGVIIRRRKKRSDTANSDLTTEQQEGTGIRARSLREIDWEAVCKAADTIVFLMFVTNMDSIRAGLLHGGLGRKTPVAAIQWGTTPMQRVLTSTLDRFADKFQKENLQAPAVLVIGEVVRLSEKLNQISSRPLYGKKVLLTFENTGLQSWRRFFEDMGASVEAMPLVEIPPLADDQKVLDSIAFELEDATHLLLTQEELAETFENALERSGMNSEEYFRQHPILCTDVNMLQLIESLGLYGIMIPQPLNKNRLQEVLGMPISESRIVLVEGEDEWNTAGEKLEDLGAKVFTIAVSGMKVNEDALEKLNEKISTRDPQIIVWENSEAVAATFDMLGDKAEDIMNEFIHITFNDECDGVFQGYQLDTFLKFDSFSREELLEKTDELFKWIEE